MLVLFAVSLLSFVLIFLSDDPVAALVPLNARAEDMAKIRHQYNLDQPILAQYLLFVAKAFSGDLGESFRYKTAALPLVLGRLPTTLLLACASVVFSTAISLPLGVLAATRRGRFADGVASILALLAISMPSFWLGVILILVFAGALRVLPASGSGTWQQLVLPTITISAFSIGLLTRLVRRAVGETLRQPFVTTARAKGLSERAIAWVHVLRNGAISVVTVMGLHALYSTPVLGCSAPALSDTPGLKLWRLKKAMWRAVRLMVDVDLHCRGRRIAERKPDFDLARFHLWLLGYSSVSPAFIPAPAEGVP